MKIKIKNLNLFIRILNIFNVSIYTYQNDLFDSFYSFNVSNITPETAFKIGYVYNQALNLPKEDLNTYLLNAWKTNNIY